MGNSSHNIWNGILQLLEGGPMRILSTMVFLLSIESWSSPQFLNYVISSKCTIEKCDSPNFNCRSYSSNNTETFTVSFKNGERRVGFMGINFQKGFAHLNQSGDFFGEIGSHGEVHWTGVSGHINSDYRLEVNLVTNLSPNQTSTCRFIGFPSKY